MNFEHYFYIHFFVINFKCWTKNLSCSPANLILMRSSGWSMRVDTTPPEIPATKCSYLKWLRAGSSRGPPLPVPVVLIVDMLRPPDVCSPFVTGSSWSSRWASFSSLARLVVTARHISPFACGWRASSLSGLTGEIRDWGTALLVERYERPVCVDIHPTVSTVTQSCDTLRTPNVAILIFRRHRRTVKWWDERCALGARSTEWVKGTTVLYLSLFDLTNVTSKFNNCVLCRGVTREYKVLFYKLHILAFLLGVTEVIALSKFFIERWKCLKWFVRAAVRAQHIDVYRSCLQRGKLTNRDIWD